MRGFPETIERLARPVEVFFRNDDGAWADAELFALLDLFEENDLPIDLAVIPAALEKPTAAELNARRAGNPGLGLHQHGFAHVNYEPAERRKCEFGPARPVARKLADVIAGRERLADLLAVVDPIFTPPWNRCSADLEAGLSAHGFALFSADCSRKDPDAGIARLPVTLDWERARREQRLEEALCEQFEDPRHPVGIMLHHAEMNAPARVELARVLEVVRSSDAISVRPMRHWITEKKA